MRRRFLPIAVPFLALVLASCGGGGARTGFYREETFAGDGIHQRHYTGEPHRVCEAARDVMLGQGYVLRQQAVDGLAMIGVKEFKADDNCFAVLELHASCEATTKGTTLYVTALEARFDVRKSKSSTSVGVPLISPLSISSSTTSEAQMKTLGETVEDARFYRSFYSAVEQHLKRHQR